MLTINVRETHAIMGPKGANKSLLGYTHAGRPGYEVTRGSGTFEAVDLFSLDPHGRAAASLFPGFQCPVENHDVSNLHFLREALNAHRTSRG